MEVPHEDATLLVRPRDIREKKRLKKVVPLQPFQAQRDRACRPRILSDPESLCYEKTRGALGYSTIY